ncbi:pyrethroid hydrolase Ces2a isoform X1 [Leguminivora glycinivorella]|uniref:pyrethroid hydrolase Ces2a isoform X1 n=2 Tax=Leguminivora glycinivorella TaxID=1035111 RepID=UPI00200FDC9B|nr:pyrethroid hydrolase Ces2a isoform X1 [Leguminivora glycinivorella]
MDSVYLFWCLFTLSYVIAQDPTVTLPQGRIVGIRVYTTSSSLTPVEVFFGVPYAANDFSSVFTHRFAAPTRHPGWSRTFFAHKMPQRCPQLNDSESDNFNENCLFLNIWTPRRADGKSLPVMVILYSESWSRGGVTLPCQELAAEGVVVVTVAYRLHALSFFTLGSIAARGNLALLDQYLAMLWVRENIAAFGGDPTTITLLGHSAGADSILHHITSPRAIGLFQRAIVMSPRDIWHALGEDMHYNATDAEKVSRELARSLGCTSVVDLEILRCLRGRPLSDILAVYSNTNWSSVMRPVPDNFLPESQYYLPNSLSVALSATKLPTIQLDLLLGTTDLEAINYNDGQYDELLKRGAAYVTEYADTKVIPKLLRMFSMDKSDAISVLSEAVRWEYWGPMSRDSEGSVLARVEATGRAETAATWGAGGALLAARLARRVSRLFVYRYSQPGGVDLHGRQINYTGAVHGTDLVALLGDALMLQIARRPATRDERRISSMFQKYITNFVKFGSPGSEEWRRYRAGEAHVQELRACTADNCGAGADAGRDTAFWLQHLPRLASLFEAGQSEPLTLEKGESRLRGGVFALCAVSAVLLLLLCACALVLRRECARRADLDDDSHHSHQ